MRKFFPMKMSEHLVWTPCLCLSTQQVRQVWADGDGLGDSDDDDDDGWDGGGDEGRGG